MKTIIQNILPLTLVFTTLIACQERKQLKEMHDSTDEMNQTTKGMAHSTENMNGTTKTMSKDTTEMKNTTKDMSKTTKDMNNTTKEMNTTTKEMAGDTREMKLQMSDMGNQMTLLNKKMDLMGEQTIGLNTKMDKMVVQTGTMNQQMTAMSAQMGQTVLKLEKMQVTTDQVLAVASETFDSLRQGDSLTLRRNALAQLLKQEPGVKSDVLVASRLSEAGKYFMSFEYQLWSNLGEDRESGKRLEMAATAAKEFMRDVQQFMQSVKQIDPPEANSEKNTDQALNVLSAAMSAINPKQSREIKINSLSTAIDSEKIQSLTMYDMVKTAVLAGKEIRDGKKKLEDFPAYVEEILNHEHVALLLLRTRHLFLVSLTLAKISNVTDGLAEQAKMFTMEWHPNFSRFNIAELKEVNRFIKGAVATKQLLIDLGVETKSSYSLDKILANAVFNIEEVAQRTVEEQALIKETMDSLFNYREIAATK
jgi:hypothetical protein